MTPETKAEAVAKELHRLHSGLGEATSSAMWSNQDQRLEAEKNMWRKLALWHLNQVQWLKSALEYSVSVLSSKERPNAVELKDVVVIATKALAPAAGEEKV